MRQLIFEYFISQLIFCCWITFINFVKAVFSLHDVKIPLVSHSFVSVFTLSFFINVRI